MKRAAILALFVSSMLMARPAPSVRPGKPAVERRQAFLARCADVFAWVRKGWAWADSGAAFALRPAKSLHPAIEAVRACPAVAYAIGQPDPVKTPEAQSWATIESNGGYLRLCARHTDLWTMRTALDAAVEALQEAGVRVGRFRDVRLVTSCKSLGPASFTGAVATIALV